MAMPSRLACYLTTTSLSLFRSIDAFCGENETTTFFVLLFFCEKTKGFGVPFRKAVQKVKVVVIVTKEYNLYVVVTMNSLAVTLLHPLLPLSLIHI